MKKQRKPEKTIPLKILIIGAGIAGPAAALDLALSVPYSNITLYERLSLSTNTEPVGYAFRIMPNSDRCLKGLGVDVVKGGAVVAGMVNTFVSGRA